MQHVYFYEKTLRKQVQRALAGFAAGVMVAASIWSLLIPAIEQSENMGALSFFPAVVGFGLACCFAYVGSFDSTPSCRK